MKTKLIILLLISSLTCHAQNAKYFAYNVLSSSIISGIGSGFHKNPGETFGHAFINGVWKGAVGGAVIYSGKELIRYSSIKNTYAYIWPARLLNSIGSSMTYNGMNNDNILQSVNINVFFTNISFDGKLHVKADPFTLTSGIVLVCSKNYTLDGKVSILSGSIVFNKSYSNIQVDNGDLTIQDLSGRNFGNTLFRNRFTKESYDFIKQYSPETFNKLSNYQIVTFCHEIIHTFQYENFGYKTINIKYLYINYEMGLIYLINNLKGYRNNIFEKEADYFGYSNY